MPDVVQYSEAVHCQTQIQASKISAHLGNIQSLQNTISKITKAYMIM